jgi:hypothetical protein
MTTSLDHVPTWDDIDNELEIDQQMGWQWIRHKARIGAMLIAKQGDMSLRQFIEAANRQRGAHLPTLKRATVNVYQNLHKHSALLEAKQPGTVNEARRLIAAHNAPPVPVYRDRQPQPAPLSAPPVTAQSVGQSQPQAAPAPVSDTTQVPVAELAKVHQTITSSKNFLREAQIANRGLADALYAATTLLAERDEVLDPEGASSRGVSWWWESVIAVAGGRGEMVMDDRGGCTMNWHFGQEQNDD